MALLQALQGLFIALDGRLQLTDVLCTTLSEGSLRLSIALFSLLRGSVYLEIHEPPSHRINGKRLCEGEDGPRRMRAGNEVVTWRIGGHKRRASTGDSSFLLVYIEGQRKGSSKKKIKRNKEIIKVVKNAGPRIITLKVQRAGAPTV